MDYDIWEDAEPSQVAQIEREHTKAGYLDGVVEAKEHTVQPGFDEGYTMGARLGIVVGRLLGRLQGAGLADIEAKAASELSESSLFTQEYFDTAACPRYNGEHPLIEKWTRLVDSFDLPDKLSQNSPDKLVSAIRD